MTKPSDTRIDTMGFDVVRFWGGPSRCQTETLAVFREERHARWFADSLNEAERLVFRRGEYGTSSHYPLRPGIEVERSNAQ